jgi:hypothetical protein
MGSLSKLAYSGDDFTSNLVTCLGETRAIPDFPDHGKQCAWFRRSKNCKGGRTPSSFAPRRGVAVIRQPAVELRHAAGTFPETESRLERDFLRLLRAASDRDAGRGDEKSGALAPETDRLGGFLCAQVLEFFFLAWRVGVPPSPAAPICADAHTLMVNLEVDLHHKLVVNLEVDPPHPGGHSGGLIHHTLGDIRAAPICADVSTFTLLDRGIFLGGIDGGIKSRMARKPAPVLNSTRTPSPPDPEESSAIRGAFSFAPSGRAKQPSSPLSLCGLSL